MTKLRHDRPVLRYIDNLRRESGRLDQIDKSEVPHRTSKQMPRRLQRPCDERSYERHIDVFERLSEPSRIVLDQLFEQAGSLLEARIEYIQSIGSRKKVGAKREHFEHELSAFRQTCIEYNRHCASETRDGKSPTRDWFAKLRVIMGMDWAHLEEMDDSIAETRNA